MKPTTREWIRKAENDFAASPLPSNVAAAQRTSIHTKPRGETAVRLR